MEAMKQMFHRNELVMSLNRCKRDLALQYKFCEGRRDLTPFLQFQKFLKYDLWILDGAVLRSKLFY